MLILNNFVHIHNEKVNSDLFNIRSSNISKISILDMLQVHIACVI